MQSDRKFKREAAILAAGVVGKMKIVDPKIVATIYFQYRDALMEEDDKRQIRERHEREKNSGVKQRPTLVKSDNDSQDQYPAALIQKGVEHDCRNWQSS